MRVLQPGEEERFVRSVLVPFLDPGAADDPEERDLWVSTTDPDRSWVEEDGGRFVANCAIDTMDVTVPGGAVLPMAGVTAVGVHPTHRRRGLLTEMMRVMLDDARRRGEPVAGLIASESVIYGRFGFGHATDDQTLGISTGRAAFRRPPAAAGLRLLEPDEALAVLPDLFERCRRQRAGQPNRSPARWKRIVDDPPRYRGGGKRAFFAAGPDGFLRYRAGGSDDDLAVWDLHGTSAEAEAALWRFVLDIDLVEKVTAHLRPVDEPVRWRLADPRQLKVSEVTDRLHLRILDVPAALEARTYDFTGRLVLDLVGPPVAEPAEPGCWVLDAGPAGATCRPAGPTDGPALRMEITDLGSVYLGGLRPSVLAAAGRIEELTPGSLRLADAVFSTALAPVTSTDF